MKFLHAADIHLDSPLTGLSSRGMVPEDVTRHCTRRAFANLIDLAITEDVAFVIIAGDLYDSDWRDYSTGLFFAHEMRRLDRPCFLVRGNHDALSVISKNLEPPPNVRQFSARKAETFTLDELGVVLHGRSFPERAVPEDLSADYPPPVAGRLNIGILHTSAEDSGEHQSYAPCSLSALIAKGYDYWALGHIHTRQVLHEQHPRIVFPGNIQGRHARETGAKGVTLVDVQDGRISGLEHRDTDVLRWAAVPVPLDAAETMAEIAEHLRMALMVAQETARGRPMIARVFLQGVTDRHADMAADLPAIEAECRNAAAAISGNLHIERVRLETRLPARPADVDGSAAAMLHDAFSQALQDPEVQQFLLKEFKALANQMPPSAAVGRRLPPRTLEELRALAPEAWHIVAQALGGDGAV